jgi:flagellar hook assembly protein FlgD
VDSLVSMNVGVEPPGASTRFSLDAVPNPFQGLAQISFAHSGDGSVPATISVHDLAGRRITTLHDGPVPAGPQRATWNGRNARGERVPPGVYLIRAAWPGRTLARRIVRVQ